MVNDTWFFRLSDVVFPVVRRVGWCVCAALFVAGLWSTAALIAQSGAALAVANLGIDTAAYRELGLAVSQHGLAAIPPTHPPGYPVFLSLMVRASTLLGTTHWIEGVKWVQLVCICVLAVCSWRVGATLLSPMAGVLAAVCVVWSPGYRAYAATLQYEVLAATVVWVALACGVGSVTKTRALFVGVIVGCSALVRETNSFVVFPLLLWWWGSERHCAKGQFTWCGMCLLGGAGCVVTAWIAHQWWVHGVIVPISGKSAINFEIGFNPQANGTFNVVADGLGEPSGWSFIASQPGTAAWLIVRKLGYLWGWLRDGWNVPHPGTLLVWWLTGGFLEYSACMTVARVCPAALALAGTVWGLRAHASRLGVACLLLFLVVTSAFYTLFIGSYRFLLPVLPAVYLLFSIGVVTVERSTSKMWLFPVVIITVISLLMVPSSVRSGRFVLDIPVEYLEGIGGGRVATPRGVALRAPLQGESRVVALFPAEYMPRGVFTVRISYDTSAAVGFEGELVLRRLSGRSLCKVPLVERRVEPDMEREASGLPPSPRAEPPSSEMNPQEDEGLCRLKTTEPVSIELRAKGGGSLLLYGLEVRGRSIASEIG